jgi:hypothetical protein
MGTDPIFEMGTDPIFAIFEMGSVPIIWLPTLLIRKTQRLPPA